jgi:hypothetical protein
MVEFSWIYSGCNLNEKLYDLNLRLEEIIKCMKITLFSKLEVYPFIAFIFHKVRCFFFHRHIFSPLPHSL